MMCSICGRRLGCDFKGGLFDPRFGWLGGRGGGDGRIRQLARDFQLDLHRHMVYLLPFLSYFAGSKSVSAHPPARPWSDGRAGGWAEMLTGDHRLSTSCGLLECPDHHCDDDLFIHVRQFACAFQNWDHWQQTWECHSTQLSMVVACSAAQQEQK